jgi:hypothetical protein
MTTMDADRDALMAQIEWTRAALGDTIHALAAKTDVRARARQAVRSRTSHLKTSTRRAVHDGAHNAQQSAVRAKGTVMAVAGGGAGALVGWGLYLLLRRRMTSRRRW